MKEIKEFLEKEIAKLQNELNKELETIKLGIGGIAWFLRHNSKDAFQKEWLLNNYQYLLKDMNTCTNKEIIMYLDHEIERCTKVLLGGKFIPYNSNPMHNLVELWEKETYPHYIKTLEGMKRML